MTVMEIAHRFSNGLDYAAFPYVEMHVVWPIFALCALLYAWLLIWSFRHWGKLAIARRDTLLATIPLILLVPLYYGVFPVLSIANWWFTARLLSLFFALAPSIALMMLPNGMTWKSFSSAPRALEVRGSPTCARNRRCCRSHRVHMPVEFARERRGGDRFSPNGFEKRRGRLSGRLEHDDGNARLGRLYSSGNGHVWRKRRRQRACPGEATDNSS